VFDKIVDNELHINANDPASNYNVLFGDPYPGVFKKLVVKYHYKCSSGSNSQIRVSVLENVNLDITNS
jgi:hypothetical protein